MAKKFVMAFLAVGMFLTAVACSSDPVPIRGGAKCNEDSECESGLRCLEYVSALAGGCQINGKQCTKGCTTDDDCKEFNKTYSKNFKCLAGCTPNSVTCQ